MGHRFKAGSFSVIILHGADVCSKSFIHLLTTRGVLASTNHTNKCMFPSLSNFRCGECAIEKQKSRASSDNFSLLLILHLSNGWLDARQSKLSLKPERQLCSAHIRSTAWNSDLTSRQLARKLASLHVSYWPDADAQKFTVCLTAILFLFCQLMCVSNNGKSLYTHTHKA